MGILEDNRTRVRDALINKKKERGMEHMKNLIERAFASVFGVDEVKPAKLTKAVLTTELPEMEVVSTKEAVLTTELPVKKKFKKP